MLQLFVNVDNPDDLRGTLAYGTGALVRLEHATAIGGTYTEVATQALIAGQSAYEFWHGGATTDYYRTRVTHSSGAPASAYSDPFQGGALASYASVTDLREELRLPDDSRDNLLADLLADASDWITAECGRDFYRHPQVSGTEVRSYDLDADATAILDDIISLTTVEYGTYTGSTFTAVAATEYTLLPRLGSPYSSLSLTDLSTVATFYAGRGTVRLTGVFGFASVPRLIRRATLDLARELYQQSAGGRPVGIEFGRIPPSAQTAKEKYAKRTYVVV